MNDVLTEMTKDREEHHKEWRRCVWRLLDVMKYVPDNKRKDLTEVITYAMWEATEDKTEFNNLLLEIQAKCGSMEQVH